MSSHHTTMTHPETSPSAEATSSRGNNRLRASETGVVGLLTIQLAIGYEWFISGFTKLYRGGFAAGLGDEMAEVSKDVTGAYGSFLRDVVIPNGVAFGWFILVAELAVGLALIVAATLLLLRRYQLPFTVRQLLLALIVAASIGGILMNISFHLAGGGTHPWLIPNSGFEEGVDLDSLMPLVQLAFAIVALKVLLHDRRIHQGSAGLLDPSER